MLGIIHNQLNIIFFIITNLLNRSTAVLKKIVFRVGKKALANRLALLQFLVVRWYVRIANVLGCVA
jgi:hypothetical protein